MYTQGGEPTTQKMPLDASEDGEQTVRILPEDQYVSTGGPGEPTADLSYSSQAAPSGSGQPADYSYLPSMSSAPQRQAASGGQAAQPTESLEQASQGGVRAATRRGSSGCTILAATIAFLLVACALLGFATWQRGLDGLGGFFGGLFKAPTSTIDTSSPAVVQKIQELSRLETVRYQVEKVITGKTTGFLPDFLVQDRLLLIAHGEVVAGVDLSKLKPEDVHVVTGTVTIRLPKAEIFNPNTVLDEKQTYVYQRDGGLVPFVGQDPNLETKVRRAASDKLLEAAQEGGILQQATTNAEQVLRSLVTGLGYKEVQFVESP